MPQQFSAYSARMIIGVSQRCLDYWDDRDIVRPSIKRASGKGSERKYSFLDLIKLSVVKKLRDVGLSLQKIRQGLRVLRKRTRSRDPLLHEVLLTDGQTLHRRVANPQAVEDVLGGGQLVFSVVALGRIEHELHERVLQLENKKRGRPRIRTGMARSG